MWIIIVDIINEKVLNFLWDMEFLEFICLRNSKFEEYGEFVDWIKYKGVMFKQFLSEID